ncbi:MAG: hypothetical protein AAGF11_04460 [Myxococcota bacterium]
MNYDEWVSPFADHTRARIDEFATRYRLYSSLGLPQGPMLRAHCSVNDYMFPRAEPDRLYATGLMMVYFFVFDHIYDTDTSPSSWLLRVRQRLARNVARTIEGSAPGSVLGSAPGPAPGPAPDPDHFELAIADIMAMFQSEDEAWLAGFSARLLRYIDATLLGKDTAQKRPQTSIEEYLEIRQHDSGGLWSAYLIEYAHRQYLTPEQRADPRVVRASQLCMWVCSLINDLFSYAKEKATEDAPFNAIYFAMSVRGLGELDAAHFICEQANRYLAQFEALVASPVFCQSEAIVSYTQGLREFVSGVWYWHQKSGLYTHPQSLFAELRGRAISEPERRQASGA